MRIEEKIYGQPPSKSNLNKVITINGHGSIGKTAVAKKYERSFFLQCKNRGAMIKSFFELKVKVFYQSNRPDLDNSLKIILDCLQMCKVIDNDRYCTKIIAEKFVDKNEPRIELEIITD